MSLVLSLFSSYNTQRKETKLIGNCGEGNFQMCFSHNYRPSHPVRLDSMVFGERKCVWGARMGLKNGDSSKIFDDYVYEKEGTMNHRPHPIKWLSEEK